jgi:manganese transport protein
MGEDRVDALLIFSQVILSLQLGFAVIPLIHFVSDKATMGEFAIGWKVKTLAWMVSAILVFLNTNLVIDFVISFFHNEGMLWVKVLLVLMVIFFIGLLLFITIYPFVKTQQQTKETDLHGATVQLEWTQAIPVQRIAIAVDFSTTDNQLINTAIAHSKSLPVAEQEEAIHFILIHVVESATANYLMESSDDEESRKDQERLDLYANALMTRGFKVSTALGYRNRVKEIVRIVTEEDAQLLVMGAHKHQGWKDYLFGETIEAVRHKVNIPVLIVNE